MKVKPVSSGADQIFCLPDDVMFVPVDELSKTVRDALGDVNGQFAVTRPGFRVPARLVDEATIALLREFNEPSTVVDAIVRFSKQRGLDPTAVVEEAFPMLQLFSGSQILVLDGSPEALGIPVSLAAGQVVNGFEIETLVQFTHDTEVYRARDKGGGVVALKIEQEHAPKETADALLREEIALEHLVSTCVPEVVAAGMHRQRRFLTVSWFEGVPVTVHAARIRHGVAPGWRERLWGLACQVIDCFRLLHAKDIVHGDVHGSNILVGAKDEVRLIDFGMSRHLGRGAPYDHGARAGFGWYLDPHAARTLLDGQLAPPPDPVSERFALAAFVYEIVTGEYYLEFSPDTQRAYEQILCETPLPFTQRGFESWPSVESVLHQQLSKNASDRYTSTDAFFKALEEARPPPTSEVDKAFRNRTRGIVDGFLPGMGETPPPTHALFDKAPIVAIDQGVGGYAWFLYRVGILRERPDLLAQADLWCRRAALAIDKPEAFFTPLSADELFEIDACSILHRQSGIHYVHALVCHARGDLPGLLEQSEAFLASSINSTDVVDVALGTGGVLLALTTLLSATTAATQIDTRELRAAVECRFHELARVLDFQKPPGLVARQPFSFAHGWVGVLYALMRAATVLGGFPSDDISERIQSRLRQMTMSLKSPKEEVEEDAPEFYGDHNSIEFNWIPGWCNGSAGVIPLFLLAHRMFGEKIYLEDAEWAATHTALHPDTEGHLCCGVAGRVFALLQMYRDTGGSRWLDQARGLARHLIEPQIPEESMDRTYSLFWGPLGSALALEELQAPEQAVMPIFGDFGWLPGIVNLKANRSN